MLCALGGGCFRFVPYSQGKHETPVGAPPLVSKGGSFFLPDFSQPQGTPFPQRSKISLYTLSPTFFGARSTRIAIFRVEFPATAACTRRIIPSPKLAYTGTSIPKFSSTSLCVISPSIRNLPWSAGCNSYLKPYRGTCVPHTHSRKNQSSRPLRCKSICFVICLSATTLNDSLDAGVSRWLCV